MKKLSIIILLFISTVAQAKNYFIFTDTQREAQENILKENPATWNFNFNNSTITVQTETEDVFFTFYSYQRIKSIEDDIQYDKYILDTGGAIYVDNNINGSQFLQII